MKTKLVVKGYGEPVKYERAFEPQDSPDGKGVPRYVGPHRARGWNGSAKEWDEPEAVHVKNSGHRPKRGKLGQIRIMPDTYVMQLSALDFKRTMLQQQLSELWQEEQEILKSAYLVSKPIDLQTVKDWTAEKKAKAQ